ncbi:MAG TPA: hypothetical protein VF618_25755 [Thermoanaerobaculia bacterium]
MLRTLALLAALVQLRLEAPALIEARRLDSAEGKMVTVTAAVTPDGAAAEVELEPGLWELTPRASGWWAPPSVVRIEASTATVALPLFPAGILRGTVEVPAGSSPRELTVHFQPLPGAGPATAPGGVLTCPIEGRTFACELPAGRFDLALRIQGLASLHRWEQTLATARPLDLGRLRFERGASLTGKVVFEERRDRPKPAEQPKVTIELTPASLTMMTDDARHRAAVRRVVATANARGLFHLNAPPGRYVVQARAGALLSDAPEVTLLDGREAQLRQPLVLARPRTLTLQVTPPVDLTGKPWSVRLQKLDRFNVLLSEVTATLPETGRWVREAIAPGGYRLEIGRSPDDSWYTETLDLTTDVDHHARIRSSFVHGTITLGGKPLEAQLTFTSDRAWVPVVSDANGEFRVLLPFAAEGTWPVVKIVALQPAVQRTLNDVRVVRDSDDALPRIEIELPGKSLRGVVVNREGEPQPHALVHVEGSGDFAEFEAEHGAFEAAGLLPGTYALRAFTRDAETEGFVEVTLEDDTEAAPVQLVVLPSTRVHGTIMSAAGPVSGAAIAMLPRENRGIAGSPRPVEADGSFDFRVSAGTADVFLSVVAPGYAWRLLRVPVQREPLPVAMESLGGTLVVEPGDRRDLWLLHGGAFLAARGLGYFAGATAEGTRFVVDSAESGEYALCDAPSGGRCSRGVLARGGTVVLKAPEER